jgi:hypothetical protein
MTEKTTKPAADLTREELVAAFRLAQEETDSLRQQVEELEEEARSLQSTIDSIDDGWTLSSELADDDPALPIPRLELRWTQLTHNKCRCLYALVRRPLGISVKPASVHPFGEIEARGRYDEDTFESDGRPRLPLSLGAMIMHDSVHLGLPAIWIGPGGKVVNLLDEKLGFVEAYRWQREAGLEVRRTLDTEKS